MFLKRSAHGWPLFLETECQQISSSWAASEGQSCPSLHTHGAQLCHVSRSGTLICKLKLLRFAWNDRQTDSEQRCRSQSSSPTLLLGCPCDGVLEGFAARVVSSTHSTFILLLRGAKHTIAAHFLFKDERKVSFMPPEQRLLSHPDTRKTTHLTLSTHTHAVGVLVGAASAVQDHTVREGDGACLFGLAMQVAAFVSCKTNTTKAIFGKVINTLSTLFVLRASAQWVSVTLRACLSQSGAPGASGEQTCQTSPTRVNPSVYESPLGPMDGIQKGFLLLLWH